MDVAISLTNGFSLTNGRHDMVEEHTIRKTPFRGGFGEPPQKNYPLFNYSGGFYLESRLLEVLMEVFKSVKFN